MADIPKQVVPRGEVRIAGAETGRRIPETTLRPAEERNHSGRWGNRRCTPLNRGAGPERRSSPAPGRYPVGYGRREQGCWSNDFFEYGPARPECSLRTTGNSRSSRHKRDSEAAASEKRRRYPSPPETEEDAIGRSSISQGPHPQCFRGIKCGGGAASSKTPPSCPSGRGTDS